MTKRETASSKAGIKSESQSLEQQLFFILVTRANASSCYGTHSSWRLIAQWVSSSRAALALFERSAGFLAPEDALRELSGLRQLAAAVGDAHALSQLHLAVARVEGCRGLCLQARRHLEIARKLANQVEQVALQCAVDQVETGLELVIGNLDRARELSERALTRAEGAGLVSLALGCATNLGTVATSAGQVTRARAYLHRVVEASEGTPYIRAGALDALAQVELSVGNLTSCQRYLEACNALESRAAHPVPSLVSTFSPANALLSPRIERRLAAGHSAI